MNNRVDLTEDRDFRYDNEERFPTILSSAIEVDNFLFRFSLLRDIIQIDSEVRLKMHSNIDNEKRKEIRINERGKVYIERLQKDFNTCERCGIKIIQEGLCDKCDMDVLIEINQRNILKRERIESFKRLE